MFIMGCTLHQPEHLFEIWCIVLDNNIYKSNILCMYKVLQKTVYDILYLTPSCKSVLIDFTVSGDIVSSENNALIDFQ